MSFAVDKNLMIGHKNFPTFSKDSFLVFVLLLRKLKQSFKRTKSSSESEQRFFKMNASIPCIRHSKFNFCCILFCISRGDIAPCSTAIPRLNLICAVPVFTPFFSVLNCYLLYLLKYDNIKNNLTHRA